MWSDVSSERGSPRRTATCQTYLLSGGSNTDGSQWNEKQAGCRSFHQSDNQIRSRDIGVHKNTGHAYSQDVLSFMLGREGKSVHTGTKQKKENRRWEKVQRRQFRKRVTQRPTRWLGLCVRASSAQQATSQVSSSAPKTEVEFWVQNCVSTPSGGVIWNYKNLY